MTRGLKPSPIKAGTSTLERAPPPPSHLSRDAKAEWRRVAPILVERRVLPVAALGVLERYAPAVGMMREATKHIQIAGIVLDTGKRNPSVGILTAAQTQALRAANDLGLTPAARSRAGMMGGAGDDDDFIFDFHENCLDFFESELFTEKVC